MFLLPQIEVRQTKEKGKGVFATGEIEPGSVIGDYLGIVTKPDEGLEYENNAVYDMWYSDKADICPLPDDDGVHLLNTSCEPNCAMTALGRHTIIFALRRIFPSEELTYDYFMGDQDDECESGSDNCHCGSDFCRGTIYSNPQAYAQWDEHLEELIEDEPEKLPVAYGASLPALEHYPESIEDHPIYPLFGHSTKEPMICTPDVLSSLTKVRKHIRESGCRLEIPEIGMMVEGVMYGGHLAMKHLERKKMKISKKVAKLVTA